MESNTFIGFTRIIKKEITLHKDISEENIRLVYGDYRGFYIIDITDLTEEQRNVDNLNAVAGLSDEQKTKVKDLATTRITKADAIKAKYKGQAENKETMQNEIAAVRKEYRQSVKAILTPEQIEKLKSRKKEGKGAENVIDAND
jgi:Spy/CpxP family protein refolding chaperone